MASTEHSHPSLDSLRDCEPSVSIVEHIIDIPPLERPLIQRLNRAHPEFSWTEPDCSTTTAVSLSLIRISLGNRTRVVPRLIAKTILAHQVSHRALAFLGYQHCEWLVRNSISLSALFRTLTWPCSIEFWGTGAGRYDGQKCVACLQYKGLTTKADSCGRFPRDSGKPDVVGELRLLKYNLLSIDFVAVGGT